MIASRRAFGWAKRTGNSCVSTAVKYLTQSTWSHAALYVGTALAEAGDDGVRSVGIDEFRGLNTRICRPVGLSKKDCSQLMAFAIARLGNHSTIFAMSSIWPAICCPRHRFHQGFAASCWRSVAAIRRGPFARR